jgi:thioredoxin reductase
MILGTRAADHSANSRGSEKFRVAIVGGGPGGLFAAWHLRAKAGDSCEIYPDSWVIRKMACQAKILGFDFGYPDSWVIRKMACQAKILGFDFGP